MRQLFVSDLDGTLLDSEATISDTSKRILNQAIDELRDQNVAVNRVFLDAGASNFGNLDRHEPLSFLRRFAAEYSRPLATAR